MTPPVDPAQGPAGRAAEEQPAVSHVRPSHVRASIDILRQRADFLRAAQAKRQGTTGFLLQARQRRADEAVPDLIRVGFTCSKKIGNAVMRNRAKRRLRALSREVMPALAQPGWDYVLVGRPEATVSRLYADMLKDLQSALTAVHKAAAKLPAP